MLSLQQEKELKLWCWNNVSNNCINTARLTWPQCSRRRRASSGVGSAWPGRWTRGTCVDEIKFLMMWLPCPINYESQMKAQQKPKYQCPWWVPRRRPNRLRPLRRRLFRDPAVKKSNLICTTLPYFKNLNMPRRWRRERWSRRRGCRGCRPSPSSPGWRWTRCIR